MDLEVVVSRVLPELHGENTGLPLVSRCPVPIPHIISTGGRAAGFTIIKNVSRMMVACNNAGTVVTGPAVSKNRLVNEEYEGVYCSWDRLI